MRPSLALLAALLALAAAADPRSATSRQAIPPGALDPDADPGCLRGIAAGGACCPDECGECGGDKCQQRPAGPACCIGIVLGLGRQCDDVGPPCAIFPPMDTTPTPPAGVSDGPTPTPSSAPPSNTPLPTVSQDPSPSPPAARWVNIDAELNRAPRARSAACFLLLRGKGYFLGGVGKRRKIDIFDPRERKWRRGAKPPAEFHSAQCVAVGRRIYVVASWAGPAGAETNNAQMFIYDTGADSWSARNGLPEARRRGAAGTVAVGNSIYVVGGNTGGGPGSSTVPWTDVYDVRARTWTELKDLPRARDHAHAAVVGGLVCVAGGRDSSQANAFAAVEASTFCFDTGKGKWMKKKKMPGARAGGAVGTTCAGMMMVAGGETGMAKASSRVDVFDGEDWMAVEGLVDRRHSTGLGVARCKGCGQIFIAGGDSKRGLGSPIDSTEVFLPDGEERMCRKY